MSGSSSGFLTKSIILLGLVLLCMGASMYVGKELGRNIMSLTRDNIEDRFPEVTASESSDDGEYVLDVVSGRSSFGFNSDEFGRNPFPREWADPEEEEFSEVSDDPAVEIVVLEEGEEADGEEGVEGDEAESESGGDSGESGSEARNRTNIFELGDESTFRIQVGTFTERENAENVWDSLTTAGYNASVSTFTDGDEVRYRVTVGIYHDRDEADAVAEDLRRNLNLDAWVYEVE